MDKNNSTMGKNSIFYCAIGSVVIFSILWIIIYIAYNNGIISGLDGEAVKPATSQSKGDKIKLTTQPSKTSTTEKTAKILANAVVPKSVDIAKDKPKCPVCQKCPKCPKCPDCQKMFVPYVDMPYMYQPLYSPLPYGVEY